MSVTNAAAAATDTELDQLSVNTIRTLSIDAVERAKSGHPGTPMALAPRWPDHAWKAPFGARKPRSTGTDPT
jgi:hypothetical protein